MTVLTKVGDIGGKPAKPIEAACIDSEIGTERVVRPRRYVRSFNLCVYHSQVCQTFFLTFISVGVLTVLLLGAILLMIHCPTYPKMRFRGYCSVPIDVPKGILKQDPGSLKQKEGLKLPLHWASDPEAAVFTTVDGGVNTDTLNGLLEHFDINDKIEKIAIYNNGYSVDFIHDFSTNATGIVDSKRCFTMDLNPEVVLEPGLFVFNIQNGETFDVMHVYSKLQALVPPTPHLLNTLSPIFAEKCGDNPTYKLERTYNNRRKRSPGEPEYEYMHFAGNHVEEISIVNFNELLEYEKMLSA